MSPMFYNPNIVPVPNNGMLWVSLLKLFGCWFSSVIWISCTIFLLAMYALYFLILNAKIPMKIGVIPKVPWLTRTTLRPFRCLCYHQRQLLLFLIHTHGGKSSIFYVYLLSFIYWAQKYTVTIYLNWNTSL